MSRDAADRMDKKRFSSIERPSSSLCTALFSIASRLAQCSEGLDETSAMYREMHQSLVRESSKRLWEVWSSLCDSESVDKDVLTVDYYVMEYLFGSNPEMKRKMNDFRKEFDDSHHQHDAKCFVSNSSLLLSSLFSSSSSFVAPKTVKDESSVEVVYVAPVVPRFALLPVKKKSPQGMSEEKVTSPRREKKHNNGDSSSTQQDDTPTKALKFVGKVVGGELFSKAKSLWRQ